MFERFTNRSRRVMAMANIEACRRGYDIIDTQHILLALVIKGHGVGAHALKEFPGGLAAVRVQIEKDLNPAVNNPKSGKLPQTPGAKKVVEYAIKEARNLGHEHVGTEHLLLGLLRQSDGKAAQVLADLGITIEPLRNRIADLLDCGSPDVPSPSIAQPSSNLRIEYRSPAGDVEGPTLKHVLAGIFFGTLFLASLLLSLFMLYLVLVMLVPSLFVKPGSPSPPATIRVAAPILCFLCFWGSRVILRLTIRQFTRRPKQLR